MKCATVVCGLGLATGVSASHGSPIGKIVSMLGDLEQKVVADGDFAQKAYEAVSEFCSDRQRQLSFEVKTGLSNEEDLKAVINKASADIGELDAKISDLAAATAKDEKELKAATELRTKEKTDFTGIEKDLVDTVETLERASLMISRNINKGSFLQLQGLSGLTKALQILVQANSINTADGSKLTALLQSYGEDRSEEEDGADASGAPDSAAYENQSGGILDLLQDLQSKAEEELNAEREAESKAQHNYDMIKQSLDHALKVAQADMTDSKKTKAANEEHKAVAEGDLVTTQKDLYEDQKALRDLHRHCMSKAADFEAETTSRGEELKALATAKKVIKEATGASALIQVSFLQIAKTTRAQTTTTNAHAAVTQVRDLAVTMKSKPLARLASRMEALLQGHAGNPFGKIAGMLKSMISRLEAEASSEGTEKAFCDKALAENNEKKDDATTDIEQLNVKMEQGVAARDKLKEQVQTLNSELANMAHAQMEMDHMRSDEKKAYKAAKEEMDKGLAGLKAALEVLREYYDKQPEGGSSGAASGIIGLLEVCESDFSKGLAELNTVEGDSATDYTAETQENAITKVVKNKDVDFKTKEIASLKKATSEQKSDRGAVQDELDAILLTLASLEKQCIAKAETFEQKTARTKQEIEGLKEALKELGGASLIQSNSHLRKAMLHHAKRA